MPVVAMCPYCRSGGVRAPERAVGWTATCPTCKSSFTIVATETAPASRPGSPPPPPPTRSPVEETRPHALAEDVTEPSPVLPPDPPRVPSVPIVRAPGAAPPPSAAADAGGGQGGFGVALGAVTLFGVGLLASQFPYGRVVGLVLCGVGLVTGLVCLAAEGRTRLVAIAAAALNFLAVVLLLLAPGWLGLDPWRGAPDAEAPKQVVALGHGTNTTAPADWVDATRATWGYGDVRVTVASAAIAPVELTGPTGATKPTKEHYLQLVLRVANAGVERRVELSGWAAGRADGVRLTDPAGQPLRAKAFDPGWEPPARPKPGGLFPGKSAEVLLVFEPPPAPPTPPRRGEPAVRVEYLRLEMPGEAVGLPEQPVRFHIPGSFLSGRPGPRGVLP